MRSSHRDLGKQLGQISQVRQKLVVGTFSYTLAHDPVRRASFSACMNNNDYYRATEIILFHPPPPPPKKKKKKKKRKKKKEKERKKKNYPRLFFFLQPICFSRRKFGNLQMSSTKRACNFIITFPLSRKEKGLIPNEVKCKITHMDTYMRLILIVLQP